MKQHDVKSYDFGFVVGARSGKGYGVIGAETSLRIIPTVTTRRCWKY